MHYDKAILSDVLREMEAERATREKALAVRCAQVYEALPRVRQIEDALRSTAAMVMRTALESGEDPTDAIMQLRERNLALQEERTALLVRNGFASDYLTLRPACPACADLGYIGTQACQCLRKLYAQKLTQQLSTVLPIADQNFACFQLEYYPAAPDARMGLSPRENMAYNLEECRNYARHFGEKSRNLLLYGPPGLGKTFLSTSIAKEVSEQGYSVAYDTAVSIFNHYETQKFNSHGDAQAASQIHKYRQADLLIIDDLGAELTTAFTVSALYDILSNRLMRKKATILNTNLLPVELEKRYSAAIASRVLGEFLQLRFFGEDIRQKQRLRNL